MPLEHAILGLLAERPRSGYDIKNQSFDGPLSAFWSADQAQIYRTLDRLEREGAVLSRRRRQRGRPDRRIYELTPAGRQRLEGWLATPHPPQPLRDPFLLQLWFSAGMTDEELGDVLSATRDEHQARLDALRAQKEVLAADTGSDGRTSIVRRMAVDGAITRYRAAIDWLDDAVDEVSESMPQPGESAAATQRRLFGWS